MTGKLMLLGHEKVFNIDQTNKLFDWNIQQVSRKWYITE